MIQARPSIFIVGHYGFQNVGDEAILGSLIGHLRERRSDLRITVASGNPGRTADEWGVDALQWSDMSAIVGAIASADLVIVGGGGLFHDYWGVSSETFLTDAHSGLSYFTGPLALAALYEKPAMLYGVGVGPLYSGMGQIFTRFACQVASVITVRDAGSKHVLESIGVAAERIIVTADPAFGTSVSPDENICPMISAHRGAGPTVAVSARNWSIGINSEYWETEFASGLDLFLAKNGGTVIFVPSQRTENPEYDDVASSERIRSRMKHSHLTSVLDAVLSPAQVLATYSQCDLVVGLRLHAMILGIVSRTPVVAVSYDPKVAQVMRQAGIEDFKLEIQDLKASTLAEVMTRAITERRPAPVGFLSEQSRLSAQLAIDILDRKEKPQVIHPDIRAVMRWGIAAQVRQARQLQDENRHLFVEYEHYRKLSSARTSEATVTSRHSEATVGLSITSQCEIDAKSGGTPFGIEALREELRRLDLALYCRAKEVVRLDENCRRLETERDQFRLKVEELEVNRAACAEHNAVLIAEASQLRSNLATAENALTQSRAEILILSRQVEHRREQIEAADERRARMYRDLIQFGQTFASVLESYRTQRAWKAMLLLRKGYTLITRTGMFAFLKWVAAMPLLGFRGLEDYELKFPDVWNLIPDESARQFPLKDVNAAASAQRKYDVIILAIFDFDFRFQRPQQMAVHFASMGHRVFWVSPARFLATDSDDSYAAIPLRANVWEVHPRGERPDLYAGRITTQQVDAIVSSIGELRRDFDICESCVLAQFPSWRQTALDVRARYGGKIVYDCMDDWQNWTAEPRVSAFNLNEERKLTHEADLLVVSSESLRLRYSNEGLEPLLVRNGSDFEFFANVGAAWDGSGVSRPIAGYYGAIADWFDVDLMVEVARARPDYQFVLIGQVHGVDVARLLHLANVHLLGEKSYRELPRYLAAFDVAIIPFKINVLTTGVDPVKLYEYFSQGKPVVATELPELQRVGDLVFSAASATEFAKKLDLAIAEHDSAWRERRIEFARENTWTSRVTDIDLAIRDRFSRISILIVTYNSGEFVRPCLESIARNTSWPDYEVIVVDNNSTDDSAAIADEIARSDSRVRVLRSGRNLGFAGANNLAARNASGEYLLFLNADTLVTAGWVWRLVRHLETTPMVGAVTSLTNFSGNETKVNCEYRDVDGMERFAARLAFEHRGQTSEIFTAAFYCVLVPRTVWDEVGELDDSFAVGMFEDDDFSLRLRNAGYHILVAEDCFVHHFGNGSFAKLPSEQVLVIFESNKKRFEDKWNRSWQAHSLRPGVRAPYDEMRFSPAEFCQKRGAANATFAAPMILRRLHPSKTKAGQAFNVQARGEAAIVVECDNATPGTLIVMGSQSLQTTFGNRRFLSAVVPPDIYIRSKRVPVYLLNDFGKSNMLEFEIE